MTATANMSHMQDLVGIKMSSDKKGYEDHGVRIDHNPDRFKESIICFQNPRCTVLVFDSGKVVSVGARQEDVSIESIEKSAKIIRDLGFKAIVRGFAVHNFVVSWSMGVKIKPTEFARENRKFCSYEPELFSGCIYMMEIIKIMIFINGTVYMTGIKNKSDIPKIFHHITSRLAKFLYPSLSSK